VFDTVHIELWIGFWTIVGVLLMVDLLVFNRKAHKVSIREALIWSVVWIGLSLTFNGAVWWLLGADSALDFLTAYLIEKSLSVDNLFVFLVLFSYFGVAPRFQHRVLFWGVFGAIVLRGVMIFGGVALVERFHWVLYLFGGFLVFSGIKLALSKGETVNPDKNLAVRIGRRIFPLTEKFHGQKFFVRIDGKRLATPVLLVLISVEFTDVLFAVDSIPAVFGITTDGFIILTSNIFAILGLRALYFLLAGIMDQFQYLPLGLAIVLTFIGVKMLVEPWVHIGTGISLAVVGGILTLSVIASAMTKGTRSDKTGKPPPEMPPDDDQDD
jgi:tellurite resistance protein TerC